jgi:hypothetical protein
LSPSSSPATSLSLDSSGSAIEPLPVSLEKH